MNQKTRISASITTLLMLLHFFATGQMTVYNNFGEGRDGWDYNYGLGWTISVDSVENNYGSSGDFTLSQNYPNPFNSSTNISYTLSNPESVQLRIYDMYGREIQTLVNKYSAPWNYTVAYNTSHLSNGIYFCRLQHGNQIEIIKMSCLK